MPFGRRGSRAGRLVAFALWTLAVGGCAFAVGLATTAPQWFYDISYNPLVPAMIAIAVSVAIWWIDRSGKNSR